MNTIRLSVRPALGWLRPLLKIGTTLGVAIGLAIALVGSLWAPTALAADNTLVSSTPGAGTTVDSSPTVVELKFVQPLGPDNTLTMTCGGVIMPLASAVVLADQLTLSASLVSAAPKGECVVAWVITDTNLQPAGSGSFTFTVANDPVVTVAPETTTVPAGDTAAPATTAATTSTPGAGGSTATTEQESGSNGPLGLFRLFSNLGLAVLFGSFVLIAIAWPEGVEYILTVRFLRTTWMFTVASTYLFVGALAANQAGTGIGSALAPTGWGDLLDTTPGKAALVRMVFVAASAYAVMRPERVIDPGTQLPALLPPGIAVITMAFSRSEFSLIENATGAVHALAMAVWLGGLILLTRVVLAGPGEEDLVHAVRGFARIATPALWATVVTGAIQLFQLDRGALDTDHGLVVIVKALFVSVMVFVGVAARQFISQRVSRVDSMTAPLATRLRRALGIEALIGVLVLALTSWLLALTPPGLVADGSSGSLQLGAVHSFQNAAAGAEVTVAFSERVGANDVRIEVLSPATGLTGLTIDFIPPVNTFVNGMTINSIPLVGPGAAVLQKSDGFTLLASGTWTLIVSANGAELARQDVFVAGDSAAATTTIAP
ncbi:MAG: CopD family protein [Ilumatobacteraceae bacterium]|nr:CopD family protein [Ilumatobacteraceae bacterium]